MAILINGNGNQAIYAAQDADLIASICGGVTSIAQVGNEFAYDLLDANTIGVQDGVILTKEGRRIQLDVDNIDEFAIPNGQQGTTSYYIIGYKLVTDAESKQTAQTFVQLMDNGTDTIPEDTFRGGADEVYVSLYRVTQDGLNIDTVDLLLPKFSNINDVKLSLTDNSKVFKFGYQNGKYGYYKQEGGADTFSPFSSEKQIAYIKGSDTSHAQITLDHNTNVIYYCGSYPFTSSVMGITVNGENMDNYATTIMSSNYGSYQYGLYFVSISGDFKAGDVVKLTTTQSATSMCATAYA